MKKSNDSANEENSKEEPIHFIKNIIEKDIAENKNDGKVVTRFPPEPNGYLHIGHAKSIFLNFTLAEEYGGTFHLRFDDTNPEKEDTEYVEAIKRDIKWLGCDWGENQFFASDYFEKLYEYAVTLIKKGKAYVCSLNAEQIREYRGSLTEPGKNSPYRDRSVEENLELFQKMRDGEFAEGEHILRAKIDMASPNLNMRDPALYRIRKVHHHRTGDKWCIYPMYDYAHCTSDAIEGITHSICTLEFENHRPLYDWCLDEIGTECHPQQIEFAKLNLTHVIMGKRHMTRMVNDKIVDGWDDPRMPTIAAMRRRGFTARAIRNLCERVGVAKRENTIEMALLDYFVREDLNSIAPRVMGVLKPLKLVITNYPEDKEELLDAPNHPTDESYGTRQVPFSKVLYIEQDDFMENPPKKYFRMTVGREVRLRYGYYVTCTDVVKDDNGEILEVHCTYDPETKGGSSADNRKVKATIHWVSAKHALEAEVRLYEHLFAVENPSKGEIEENLNPNSLTVTSGYLEPSVKDAKAEDKYQFERVGYFCVDKDSSADKLVFNRTITLKDSWAKVKKKK
ncbi:glutamine--tRNA ligase/YqeY domain fusion protein [Candidatus Uabimicrobium amorphum]|uniref:Glutamine--tRNA ligase n=1 Tax=Uabimicrobium amorphum TaxID=2596890 RepID=A0A5S9INF4_UABAM|nr:glutamine--tRNA ligase/YqeY domain fusion protein [Candidatus Uabimicrobium amorphum]BBM84270.1 glutamine--tRNA ligase [Candidatus Uabimicrobium amorphum]